MQIESNKPSAHYWIAPQLRRCLYYALVSIPLLAGVAIWVNRFLGQPNVVGPTISELVIFSVAELTLLLPLTWKLCVDERGIARRFLGRWDFWTWDDFASGRIEKRDRYTFYDPTRPWWRRKLRLDCMATKERGTLVRQINEHYRLPPPPEVPESITIKYGLWRSTTFDGNGIHHTIRSQPREYLWSDVARVRITRLEPLRRDFSMLQIFFPDEELKLQFVSHQGGRSPTWRGPEADVIAEFLQKHLSPARVDVDIAGERPSRREDVEAMLATAKRQTKELNWCLGICIALLLPAFVWMALDRGILPAAIMFAGYGLVIVPVCWSAVGHRRRQVAQLDQWLSTFKGAGSPDAGLRTGSIHDTQHRRAEFPF